MTAAKLHGPDVGLSCSDAAQQQHGELGPPRSLPRSHKSHTQPPEGAGKAGRAPLSAYLSPHMSPVAAAEQARFKVCAANLVTALAAERASWEEIAFALATV